ncbi:sensor histidine kinase [Haematospirillum jordaniae]|uniref:Histidine kinase domain-containing protein n=1 Tax=Haematospirillum jordaniae TaxID=1549855 RepID=A0A143DAX9_9PROT|nr:histidine kinase [Haematospirillum jordaniae]AMW33885.1 hypothetical protein AY555_00425 [Haematospirillum jordaniae]NKD44470.1 sensor histidine kinase [Haematospirillum jordaniae]NKD57490.1 sensor histidine kinase [Haematospirillum jordaniae]NKD59532.1 sensor histidine kinase [Haematospirillum jordaniae]NKD67526.1 sensor histidine kinase [Haematospirillum jordaniae]
MLPDLSSLVIVFVEQVSGYALLAWVLGATFLLSSVCTPYPLWTHKTVLVFGAVFLSVLCGWLEAACFGPHWVSLPIAAVVIASLLHGFIAAGAVAVTSSLCLYGLGLYDIVTAFSMAVCGLLAGIVCHLCMRYRASFPCLSHLFVIPLPTLLPVSLHYMLILLATDRIGPDQPSLLFAAAFTFLVQVVSIAGFVSVFRVRLRAAHFDVTAAWNKAQDLAGRLQGLFPILDSKCATSVATLLWQGLGVNGVCITDDLQVLARVGEVPYSFRPDDIAPCKDLTQPFQMRLPARCSGSDSILVIPFGNEEGECSGHLVFFVSDYHPLASYVVTLTEMVGALLLSVWAAERGAQQVRMLEEAKEELVRAQINPHFLFNSMNTMAAVVRHNPDRACLLMQEFAAWLRRNLDRPWQSASLEDELEHVTSYLAIEQVRFADRLNLEICVPDDLYQDSIPSFVLQPLVENAIKHGVSQSFDSCTVRIRAHREEDRLVIAVEDSAGLYSEGGSAVVEGMGLGLVRQKIGRGGGALDMTCLPGTLTRATLSFPVSVSSMQDLGCKRSVAA